MSKNNTQQIEEQIFSKFKPYSDSVNHLDDKTIYMTCCDDNDYLIIIGGDLGFEGEDISVNGLNCKKAPLSHHNACNLRKLFPFTAPKPVLSHKRTIGLGDRLGIACPGHIKAIQEYDVYPVFAQQSIRELNLTNRNYEDVLDSVTFSVFREGFRRGFGADGDHLKTCEEVEYALKCGYTMITLDCSEYIRNIDAMTDAQINSEYSDFGCSDLENVYKDKSFDIGDGTTLYFDDIEFKKTVLIYGKAIEFIYKIYNKYIKNSNVDFEVSIDETSTPTTPLQHFFVANELIRNGVEFKTLAPRFCGEFQKG
ncbi:MAG: hypothetical protein GX957_05575, partial [Clostridiaceae bacterium]|nr:hypothetical protein [Clostridiaceae bacterium]